MYVQQRAGERDKEGLLREARERIMNATDEGLLINIYRYKGTGKYRNLYVLTQRRGINSGARAFHRNTHPCTHAG